MPFWLANAPAMYSQLASKALHCISSSEVLCYLDDLVIHSVGHDCRSHERRPYVFCYHINYLGQEVSSVGIKILPGYLKMAGDWPVLKSIKELQAFLGKCGQGICNCCHALGRMYQEGSRPPDP